jgi:hypothetical protein
MFLGVDNESRNENSDMIDSSGSFFVGASDPSIAAKLPPSADDLVLP